jgi:hypothetical protein
LFFVVDGLVCAVVVALCGGMCVSDELERWEGSGRLTSAAYGVTGEASGTLIVVVVVVVVIVVRHDECVLR